LMPGHANECHWTDEQRRWLAEQEQAWAAGVAQPKAPCKRRRRDWAELGRLFKAQFGFERSEAALRSASGRLRISTGPTAGGERPVKRKARWTSEETAWLQGWLAAQEAAVAQAAQAGQAASSLGVSAAAGAAAAGAAGLQLGVWVHGNTMHTRFDWAAAAASLKEQFCTARSAGAVWRKAYELQKKLECREDEDAGGDRRGDEAFASGFFADV
jgi:hypothetical protein